MITEGRVCRDCLEYKVASNFHRTGKDNNFLTSYCRPCSKIRNAEYHQANLEQRARTMRQWRNEHPYYSTAKDLGVSEEEIHALFDGHDGLCSICRRPESIPDARGNMKRLAVDHCHETGALRGLLCQTCNVGIGNLQDSIEMLEKAIEYLRSYQFTAV